MMNDRFFFFLALGGGFVFFWYSECMFLYFPKGESFRIYVNGKVHKNVWKTNVTGSKGGFAQEASGRCKNR